MSLGDASGILDSFISPKKPTDWLLSWAMSTSSSRLLKYLSRGMWGSDVIMLGTC